MALTEDGAARSLNSRYGDDHSSLWPATLELALFNGNPLDVASAELDATGGYARVTLDNDSTNFPPASSSMMTTPQISFGAASAAWSDLGQYWALLDPADDTILEFAPITPALNVTGATTQAIKLTLRIGYANTDLDVEIG